MVCSWLAARGELARQGSNDGAMGSLYSTISPVFPSSLEHQVHTKQDTVVLRTKAKIVMDIV